MDFLQVLLIIIQTSISLLFLYTIFVLFRFYRDKNHNPLFFVLLSLFIALWMILEVLQRVPSILTLIVTSLLPILLFAILLFQTYIHWKMKSILLTLLLVLGILRVSAALHFTETQDTPLSISENPVTVLYKTEDRGKTWEQINLDSPHEGNIHSLSFNPNNPEHLFLLPYFHNSPKESTSPKKVLRRGPGLWVLSTKTGNTKAIRDWNGLEEGNICDIAFHPHHPKVLFAGVYCEINHKTDEYLHQATERQFINPTGIYKSTDGGLHWKQVHSLEPLEFQESPPRIGISTSNPDFLYAATNRRICKSTDGGDTWNTVTGGEYGWMPEGWLPKDPVTITIDPNNPEHLLIASMGNGIVESKDWGRTWGPMEGSFPYSHISDVALTKDNTIYATGSGGLWKYSPQNQWQGIHFSNRFDKGIRGYSALAAITSSSSQRELVLTSPMGDPTLFGIETSTSRRKTLYSSSPGQEEIEISRIEVAPSNNTVLYVGTGNPFLVEKHEPPFSGAGILISNDQGRSWERDSGVFGTRGVIDISIHPNRASTCIVATGNGVFTTNNSGSHWKVVEELPKDGTIRTIAYSPQEGNTIIAGSDSKGFFLL